MSNFIFSINATFPVFLVMAVGYILRRKDKINENFINVSNDLNFKLTLPALLFMDIKTTNIKDVFDLRYVLYCMAVTTVAFVVIWILAKIFIKDRSIIGSFVQACYRSSAAVLGVAFVQNMYGNSGMVPLMIVGAVPLFNIYAVIVLTFEGGYDENGNRKDGSDKSSGNIKKAFINICKNPIILSILAGVICSYFEIKFPVIIDKTIETLAKMATVQALLCIGASFEGRKAIKKIKPTIVGTMVKLVVLPAIFLPIALKMGFTGDKLVALLIMLGSPTTPSSFVMAKAMDNDTVLTSSMIVSTTLMSSVTLTLWIYLFKSMGVL